MKPLQKQHNEQTQKIRDEIMRVGNFVREKYPFLERHQDAIGLTIFLSAAACTIFGILSTYHNILPYWINFLIVAFSTSIIHEIEHDTIHNLYFNGSIVNDFILGIGWLLRWNTINPWTRRRFHFHHHKASGTASDIEEQGISNGEVWSLRRIFMMLDGGLAVVLRPIASVMTAEKYRRAQPGLSNAEHFAVFLENVFAYCPLGWVHFWMLYAFLAFHGLNWFYHDNSAAAAILPSAIIEWLPVCSTYLYCLGFPNAFRSFCLWTVSSNMHFFGDIEAGDVLKQTQIWRTWWTLPLDLFTFNFGTTHCIHHFVTRDTFYVRQMMFPYLFEFMGKNGVRINDFDTIFRANRYSKDHREWRLF